MEEIFFKKESSLNKQGLFETVPATQGHVLCASFWDGELNGLLWKAPANSAQNVTCKFLLVLHTLLVRPVDVAGLVIV